MKVIARMTKRHEQTLKLLSVFTMSKKQKQKVQSP